MEEQRSWSAGKHKFWTHYYKFCKAVCLLTLLIPTTTSEDAADTEKKKPKLANDTFVSFLEMEEEPKLPYIRFCDTDSVIYEDDKSCNGLVGVVVHDINNTALGAGRLVASGIFIDDKHVLTSYAPFRLLRHQNVTKNQIHITYLDAKAVVDVRNEPFYMGYFYGRATITCARQVIPVADEDITDDQWHGEDHTHSPLHDLMVMKTNETMIFCDEETWHDSNLTDIHNNTRVIHSGPLRANLAGAEDEFPERFKIISLGFMDWDHVYNKNHFHTSREYNVDDKVREDCEEWFPLDWGYFICIKNDEDFVSIGSGAVLVDATEEKPTANDMPWIIKVFGIGSFMLKKGAGSILVFTDVRPYKKEINRTCNYYDFHED